MVAKNRRYVQINYDDSYLFPSTFPIIPSNPLLPLVSSHRPISYETKMNQASNSISITLCLFYALLFIHLWNWLIHLSLSMLTPTTANNDNNHVLKDPNKTL